MASSPVDKTQFQTLAPSYLTVDQLPCSQLEAQLIASALGDCTSLSILDLAGGTGFHARRAVVAANAARVDVVDISPEMLRLGQANTVEQLGIELAKRLRWFEGDLTRPLDIAELQHNYDIVMVNWLFDHAGSMDDLRQMWENIVRYIKPGGKFIGVRALNPKAGYLSEERKGKYGITVSEVEEIEEGRGLRYLVTAMTEPERFRFVSTSMEDSMLLRDEYAKELGMEGFEVVPVGGMGLVQGDEEFWEELVGEPFLGVVVASKGG
ncbi:S-adenosyl-L-methionine-dependent methyltransferase [Cercophora samala]|uniref:S-adenosyl-L-methionine-dependent methyltransferase n=1 Tax=Cercophora samala TaxID=330535 RepID=A0AA39Z925_9PEZI|nr:S-adenosyl-L-methionine-dependent methyltransferase [Cercophora samala]